MCISWIAICHMQYIMCICKKCFFFVNVVTHVDLWICKYQIHLQMQQVMDIFASWVKYLFIFASAIRCVNLQRFVVLFFNLHMWYVVGISKQID